MKEIILRTKIKIVNNNSVYCVVFRWQLSIKKFYNNETEYSDGSSIENEILDMVKNTDDLESILINDSRWPVFYHLSHLRENLLNWYPFNEDANLLDGRLRCLRDEEQKTLKKIEVTRKKTENKMNALQAQEEELRRKMEFRNRKQKELERLREQTKKQKENNRMAIMMKAEERRRQMEEDIRNLREQKKNNEELRKYMEVEELSNKKTQADYIKSQQIIAEEKRRAIELEKKNRIKEELERKIAEEEERIQLAEGKKQKLEQEEIEIMKKLKTTTQMHEQMVENYEKLGKGQ